MFDDVLYNCIVFILRNTFLSTHYDVDNMSKVLCSDGQTGVKRLRLPPMRLLLPILLRFVKCADILIYSA